MNNILKKLNFTTTQTIIVGALALGIGSGAAFTAIHQPQTAAPKTAIIKNTDSQTPTTSTDATTTPSADSTSSATGTATSTPTAPTAAATSTPSPADSAPQPVPVTVKTSAFEGDYHGGVCNLTYSDGTAGQVTAKVSTVGDDPSQPRAVFVTENNCDSFVGTTR